MTELQLRHLVADRMVEYLGCNEADGSHREIIDLYNSIKPLPRGYKMTYNDPWCAAYPSAIAKELDLTDTILPECGCDAMIELYKAIGRWREADDYSPQVADLVMYDWQDNGTGDNTGSADHVGFIYARSGTGMTIIEGNLSDSVDFRNLKENARYIRGYCLPNYAAKARSMTAETGETEASPDSGSESTLTKVRSVLTFGTVGDDVGVLQALLELNSHSCGKYGIDKDFGNDTRNALNNFKAENGLVADGVCDEETWKILSIL